MKNSSLPLPPSPTSLRTIPSINRIPKEALQKILKYLSDDARPDDLSSSVPYPDCIDTTKRENTNWLPVTHVCQTWRREAIDYPYLWNHVQIGYCAIEETKTFIERSRGVPLSVVVISTPKNVDDVKECIDYLKPHVPMIRSLLIKLVSPESVDLFLPLFERMRDVVSIRLLSFRQKAILKHPASPNHLHFLRTLQLCSTFLVPEVHYLLENVTDLHLQGMKYDTWAEFAAFLLSFPILQKIKLVNCTWGIAPLIDSISLLYLESVELSLTKDECLHVLKAFNLSTVSRISLTCTEYHVSDPIILPSHLSTTTTCSYLQVVSTPKSIVLSSILNSNNIQQQLNISLILADTKGGPDRTWIDDIVDEWREAIPFKSAKYVHVWPVAYSDIGSTTTTDTIEH